MSKILIVEDDLMLAQTLSQLLGSCKFEIQICKRLSSAYQYLDQNQPEVVIIDRVLPDGDGLELVEFLHDHSYKTKILVLSQKAETISRVEGLKSGADDYLAKPFASQELKLRVNSLIQKTKCHKRQILNLGQIKIFPDDNLIEIGQQIKKLRKKEIQLLACLGSHQGQVVTRRQLENWLWGCQEEIPTRTALDVYIKRVRQHLGEYQIWLRTIRGSGYQLVTAEVKT